MSNLSNLSEIVKGFETLIHAAKLTGLDQQDAVIAANAAINKLSGMDVLKLLDYPNGSELYLTALEISKMTYTPLETIISLLEDHELMTKPVNKWVLTEKGKEFGIYTFKEKHNGERVQQIEWRESVIALLKQTP